MFFSLRETRNETQVFSWLLIVLFNFVGFSRCIHCSVFIMFSNKLYFITM